MIFFDSEDPTKTDTGIYFVKVENSFDFQSEPIRGHINNEPSEISFLSRSL